MGTISLANKRIDYELRRSLTSSIKLTVAPSGMVIVQAPLYIPELLINKFILSKTKWILKRIDGVERIKPLATRTYTDGDRLPFLDRKIKLNVDHSEKAKTARLFYIDGEFHAFLSPMVSSQERVNQLKPLIKNWYTQEGIKHFNARVNHYARIIGCTFKSVSLKDTISRWGSCSPDQKIYLNWRLLLAPYEVSDYVVIHEVSHLKHKHHQKPFWECVAGLDQNYKERIDWLKEYGHLLFL